VPRAGGDAKGGDAAEAAKTLAGNKAGLVSRDAAAADFAWLTN